MKLPIVFLIMMAMYTPKQVQSNINLYVSPSGDDDAPGTKSSFNMIWHNRSQPPYFRLNPAKKEPAGNVVDHNFYYWKGHQAEMKELPATLRDLDIDPNGMAVDPMFADPENGSFNINQSSPLLRNCFVPIYQDLMGLKNELPKKFKYKLK